MIALAVSTVEFSWWITAGGYVLGVVLVLAFFRGASR